MGTQLLLPKGTQPPTFGHVCCGKRAGRIKMPLGMEVGLGPAHIVLDGDPAPPTQRDTAPNFRPCLLCMAKRLVGLRCHLVRGNASAQATLCKMGTHVRPPPPPPKKKGSNPVLGSGGGHAVHLWGAFPSEFSAPSSGETIDRTPKKSGM